MTEKCLKVNMKKKKKMKALCTGEKTVTTEVA